MTTLQNIKTSEVSNLSFDSISDRVDSNWADWEVSFEYQGKNWVGFLGGCPFHPDLMHDSEIIDCEILD